MHAVTFHAVDTQMKSMHKQGVGERSEPHSLYNNKHECVRVCVTEGHRKCIDLQPNATASLDDGDCGSQKGHPVR